MKLIASVASESKDSEGSSNCQTDQRRKLLGRDLRETLVSLFPTTTLRDPLINLLSTRSVGMSLARPFKAGERAPGGRVA